MVVLADGEPREAAVPITAIHSIATVMPAAIQVKFQEVKERQPFVVGQIGETRFTAFWIGGRLSFRPEFMRREG